jgi:hypothetical protein
MPDAWQPDSLVPLTQERLAERRGRCGEQHYPREASGQDFFSLTQASGTRLLAQSCTVPWGRAVKGESLPT